MCSNSLGRQGLRGIASVPGGCVCGLDPCLAPTCAASVEHWSGTFTHDERSLAPYQGTPTSVIRAMLDLARLAPGETFVDLGAGDGRVLLEAVLTYRAGLAVGFELDPVVCALGKAHVQGRLDQASGHHELLTRVQMHCLDARKADVRSADVVGMYLLPEGHKALAPYLESELPVGSGTRVVVHQWPVPNWPISAVHSTKMGTKVFLYER
eukprot:CAMPEP_0114235560 /NCGR_PEP_ID=MMETSP0058-20121206/6316_1 /TAXON_ID=36894 /ORGANISM="Pyramimonas parkeae, CCMP726" /LENGTH=209 /DNA_ID=CAMNT_0001347331 /DNA_START=443 /DNA_END=1072 /DNA_ORIENTATION=-